jgi:hypothetical protein
MIDPASGLDATRAVGVSEGKVTYVGTEPIPAARPGALARISYGRRCGHDGREAIRAVGAGAQRDGAAQLLLIPP